MAKQSKSKARKKAQKQAQQAAKQPPLSTIGQPNQTPSQTTQNSSETVIIDDHLKVKPTEVKKAQKPDIQDAFADKSINTLRVIVVFLVILIVVLLLAVWFFYGKAHKASFNHQNPVTLQT